MSEGLTIGSLFAGVGGLELGLELALGARTVWQVECEPHCLAVLEKNWSDAERYTDVTTARALPRVDIMCGGFPCQDISLAGRGAGLAGSKSGLWFHFLRHIEEGRPGWVVIENSPGLVRRGLDVVVSGLEALGYEVEGTRLRAGDVGATHRRERLFLIGRLADADGAGGQQQRRCGGPGGAAVEAEHPHGSEAVADTAQERLEVEQQGEAAGAVAAQQPTAVRAHERTAEPGVGRGADGPADWLDGCVWPAGQGEHQHSWEPRRTVAPRSVPKRTARVKALGNAVVPQCAYVVGMRIKQRIVEGW